MLRSFDKLTYGIVGIEQNGKQVQFARAGDTIDMGVAGIDPTALRFVRIE